MVNIQAILCVTSSQGVLHFKSVAQYRTWRLAQCTNTEEKEHLSLHYNVKTIRGERYLEEMYNLNRGSMHGIHHIFSSTTRAENHLKDLELLTALTTEHFIVLETNLAKSYAAVYVYLPEGLLRFTVNFKEATEVVNLGANLSDLPALSWRN